MGRILLVLPLCLILQDPFFRREVTPPERDVDQKVGSEPLRIIKRSERDIICHDLVSSLGLMPSAGFPGGLPWNAFYQIGKKDLFPLENILVYQPTLFFQMCLDKHDREIQSYSCRFCKQERIKNRLQEAEEIQVEFREKPFSVHFNWLKGAGLAKKVMYVAGENNGNMRVRPIFGFFLLSKDPEGTEAMRTSRFSIKQYGMRLALQRTVDSMRRAEEAGTLDVRYLGKWKVDELGGRICYKFIRKPYNPPEEDELNELTFYIDIQTWMQVGCKLYDVNNELIADYFFRDVVINPEYGKDQFTDKGLQ